MKPDSDYWQTLYRLAQETRWWVLSGLDDHIYYAAAPDTWRRRLWGRVRPYVYGDRVMVEYTYERIYTSDFPDGYDRVVPGLVKRIRRPLRRILWPER